MAELLSAVASMIWGFGAPVIFFLAGVFIILRTGAIPFRGFPDALRALFKKRSGDGLPPWRALLTSIGAVMGPGNIIGVAAAVAVGGAGAVFWLWVSGFTGMALRFAETGLAVRFKGKSGGMMDVIADGAGFPKLAKFFALAGSATALLMAGGASSSALAGALLPAGVPTFATGIVLTCAVSAVLTGGGARVARAAPIIVGIATAVYLVAGGYIVMCDPAGAGAAIGEIFAGAFDLRAGLGALVGGAIRQGISKGVYSNECGMGSEPTIATDTNESDPYTQGVISMLSPFVDTVLFCGLTGVLCVMSPSRGISTMVSAVFERYIPGAGEVIVLAVLAALVLATVISWYYYGDAFTRYVFGENSAGMYRRVYMLFPAVAANLPIELLIDVSDISTAVMAFPSIAAILLLSGTVQGFAAKKRESLGRYRRRM